MIAPKGLCPICGQRRWLGGRGKICKPCGYSLGVCVQCGRERKRYVDSLCYACYEDRQVRALLVGVENNFILEPKILSDYNKYLFSLYLTYTRRSRLKYYHLKQTQELGVYLCEKKLSAFLSWMDIYQYSQKNPLPHRLAVPQKGCAWFKIGFMLQELGVLPPRSEEFGKRLQGILDFFDKKTLNTLITPFLGELTRTGRTEPTLEKYLFTLRSLALWSKQSSETTMEEEEGTRVLSPGLLSLQAHQIEKYLLSLIENLNDNPKYIRDTLARIHRFYRWCLREKKVLLNPCDSIKVAREPTRLTICSPEQVQKLYGFIKNKESNPEQALLICLILFFGLKTEDLAFAKLTLQKNQNLGIVLRRKPRSYGKRFYNRPQILDLPITPAWFFNLQKRFYYNWLSHYAKVKRTYPHQPLILLPQGHSNRPASTDYVSNFIKRATTLATGETIPPRVLRQTCGNLHTQNQDASLLTRLGWSPQFAFHYTWLPRNYFVQKATSKSPPDSSET